MVEPEDPAPKPLMKQQRQLKTLAPALSPSQVKSVLLSAPRASQSKEELLAWCSVYKQEAELLQRKIRGLERDKERMSEQF